MSLFDSVGRLFGRGAEPAFTVPPGMDPQAAMMQAEARRFEASNAPQPTPDSLKAVLAKATRVRIIEGGMFQGKALGSTVCLDTTNPDDIQGLRSAYQFLFSADGTLNDRVNEAAERFSGIAPVDDIIAFIRADSSRAICQPAPSPPGTRPGK